MRPAHIVERSQGAATAFQRLCTVVQPKFPAWRAARFFFVIKSLLVRLLGGDLRLHRFSRKTVDVRWFFQIPTFSAEYLAQQGGYGGVPQTKKTRKKLRNRGK